MPSIAKLSVDVDANTSGAEKGLSSLDSGIKSFGGKLVSGLGGAARTVSTGFAIASAATVGFGVSAFHSAARTDELNMMLSVLAKNSGVSMDSVNKQVAGVKSMGIETNTAQEMVAQFMRANLDSAHATDLARVAQDAAIVTGKNSTETLQEMLYAIQTGNSNLDIFAQMNIRGGDAVQKYADKLGKSTKELTQAERSQAIMNAFMEAGIPLQGAYATAMESPSKVLRSFPRLFDDIKVSTGQAVVQGFGPLILKAYDLVKAFDHALQPGGALNGLVKDLGGTLSKLAGPITDVVGKFTDFIKKVKPGDLGGISKGLENIGPAALGAAGALAAFGGTQIPVIGQFIGMMPPWAAGLAVMVASSKEGQQAIGGLVKAIGPLIGQLISGLMPILNQVMGIFFQLIPPIAEVAAIIISALLGAVKTLLPPIMTLVQTLLPPLVRIFSDLIKAIAPIIPMIVDLVVKIVLLAEKAIIPLLPHLTKLVSDLFPALIGLLPPVIDFFSAIVDALVPLLPVLLPIVTSLLDLADNVLPPLIRFLTPLAPLIVSVVAGFKAYSMVTSAIDTGKMVLGFAKMAPVIIKATAAAWGLNASLLANPFFWIIGGIVLLVAGFILLYTKVKWFRDGVDAALRGVVVAFHWVIDAAKAVFDWFKSNWKLIAVILLTLVAPILGVILAFVFFRKQIMKIIGEVVDFFKELPGKILGYLGDMAGMLGRAFANVGKAILDVLKELPAMLAQLFLWAIQAAIFVIAVQVIVLYRAFTDWIPTIISKLIGLGAELVKLFVNAITALPGAIASAATGIWSWFTGMVPRILSIISSFAGAVARWATDGINKMFAAFTSAANSVWNFFKALPGRIISFIAALPGLLARAATSALQAMYGAIVGAANAIWGFFQSLPGRVYGMIVGLISTLASVGSQAISSLTNAITGGAGSLFGWLAGLPGRIVGAIGDLGGLLIGAGAALIRGLTSGIESAAAGPINAAKGVADKIKSLLPFSPAKWGPFAGSGNPKYSGRAIANLLAEGITQGTPAVTSAALNLARSAQQGVAGTTIGMGATTGLVAANGAGVHIENVNVAEKLDLDQMMERLNFLVNAQRL